jgi:predicted nucleic-acid-binding protein
MISPDTNVVVRLLIADDAAQTARARKLFEAGGVLILKTVLLETEWVLRSRYELERPLIAAFLQNLVETDGVELEHDVACLAALRAYERGMGFADAMHTASAGAMDIAFHSFDRNLARKARKLLNAEVCLV